MHHYSEINQSTDRKWINNWLFEGQFTLPYWLCKLSYLFQMPFLARWKHCFIKSHWFCLLYEWYKWRPLILEILNACDRQAECIRSKDLSGIDQQQISMWTLNWYRYAALSVSNWSFLLGLYHILVLYSQLSRKIFLQCHKQDPDVNVVLT